MQYVVESKYGTYQTNAPAIGAIGYAQLISIATLLLQNSSAVASFLTSVSSALFGTYKSEPKIIGKKIFASGGKISFTNPNWAYTSESVTSFTKGTQIGKATGNFWKSRSGQNMIEVEFTRVVNGSSTNDERIVGSKAYVEIQDVVAESEPIVTPTDETKKPFKVGLSSKYVNLIGAILIQKGYLTNSKWSLQEWQADYYNNATAQYSSGGEVFNALVSAGLPTSFATIQDAVNAVNALPQKQQGGGGGNDDKEKDPVEKQDNTLLYAGLGLLALKMLSKGKGKKKKFLGLF
jgi:hypothetical protein